ncbi:MAG TPA: DUF1549 and DUF1553 domain-containing protein [Urbifossiella sp.]|jgi:hypothetical protein
MNRVVLWIVGLLPPAAAAAAPAAAADPPKSSTEAAALTARIDARLADAWKSKKIVPAEPSTDGEFLRRVYLDLAGRIPSIAEARQFLADTSADKRRRLVAELLQRPTYATHMTTVWRRLLVPEADTNFQFNFLSIGFDAWLKQQFAKNAGYDQMARELLTVSIDQNGANQFFNSSNIGQPTPIAFYFAKEAKPENLASSSARVFLGLRLECAQCHDHPFATWTRDQFWGLAAFYAGLKVQDRGEGFIIPQKEVLDRRELSIPGTDRMVQAVFPDGTEPVWKFKTGPRQTLAEWVTAKENPYFAKATVNRVWAHMFGIGLVEPVDEMVGGQDTKIYHMELLDELAKSFTAHKFDLKFLFEAIAGSKAYQLSSRGAGPAPLYSRQPLRGLTGEQLYDSLSVATGQPNAVGDDPFAQFVGGVNNRAEFLTKFGKQTGKSTEHETSIIQALTLMNGQFVGNATNPSRSELLSAVIEAPFLNEKSRVEAIYLATVSRLPSERELERTESFIRRSAAGNAPKKARTEAIADVFWALINSTEFVFNH